MTKTIRAYYASQAVNKIPFKRRKYEINVCWRIHYIHFFVLCVPLAPSHRSHSLAFHRSRTLLLSFYRLFLQIGCAQSVTFAYICCVCVCVVSSSPFTSFNVALGVVVDAISTSHYFIYCSFRYIFAVSLVATSFRYTFRRRLPIINMIVLLIFSASSCQSLIFIANFIVSMLFFLLHARALLCWSSFVVGCRLEALMRNCFVAHTM